MKKSIRLKLLRNALITSLMLSGCSNTPNEVLAEDIQKEIIELDFNKNDTITFESETIEPTVSENEIIEEVIPENEHVDLLMIGDVLVHQPVYKSGIQADGSLNYDHFFKNIQEDLDEAEIKIVNQETILGGSELGFSSYPCFNSPQEIGLSEVNAGFNVVLHATNHTMDKGYKAIQNTMDFWNNYPDIKMLGINSSPEEQKNIYIYEQNGFKIAILNYTYGTNGIPLPSDKPYLVNILNEQQITEDVTLAKSLADFVVVLPHWGTEYRYTPDSLQQKYTKLLSDLGVDLVIGTHPHVLENIEVVTNDEGHDMLVYYSLGNYVSGQTKRDRVVGGMAKVSIEKDYETGEAYITEYELDPIVTQQGEYTCYKLEDYNDELANQNTIRNKSGCSNFNMNYINDLCTEILGDDFNQEEEKVLIRLK
jgi:poly-gamma-glutamate synthesis protein (capsule biosynthesis protein)